MVEPITATGSFTEFFGLTEPRLRTALCAAFGADLGREATQQALAYGWEHWERIQEMDNPAGYLWTVGRNYGRRQRRERPAFPTVASNRTPEVEPALPAGLASLTEKQRIAVMLVYGLEWTFAEVAELMGVSKSTVQTQARRGIAKLRRHIGVNDE